MSIEIYNRIMRYAGKARNQVSNPCLTANEAIELADCIAKLEAQCDESDTDCIEANKSAAIHEENHRLANREIAKLIAQRDELLALLRRATIDGDWTEGFSNYEYDSDEPEDNQFRDEVFAAIAKAVQP